MNTPIYDFVRKYADGDTARLHMPGHKGREYLGCERLDITEIGGADVLYSPDGIIKMSEDNATSLFKTAHTYYSTQGSTLAIQAMLTLAINGRKSDTPPTVLAARNVHKAFVNAAALLDIEVDWIYPEHSEHIIATRVSAATLDGALSAAKYAAVYITSPDYLGNIADIRSLSEVCRRYDVPLLVDNAHGAYLAFTEPSMHPIALGAAMCADSAHKTLPTLTGGAYLHISKDFAHYTECARSALSLFASTSPSYLTLSSLDLTNRYLSDGYSSALRDCIDNIESVKRDVGIPTLPSEPLKMVFKCTDFGYTGGEFCDRLRKFDIECEFSDDTYAVLMLTPSNTTSDFDKLRTALKSVTVRETIFAPQDAVVPAERVMSIRKAILSPHEIIPVGKAVGRIAGTPTVSCPPAIPIVVSGEIITDTAVALFKRYGIEEIEVVKNA